MAKVVCISDTHGEHWKLRVPEGDILIHAGDFSNTGEHELLADFGEWFSLQPHKYKIVIPGNHERGFDKWPDQCKELMRSQAKSSNTFEILVDEEVTVGDYKVWGSPWSPDFFPDWWAFNQPRNSDTAKDRYATMYMHAPDIVVSHTPPYGILDECPHSVGCEVMLSYLEKLKPKLVVCGHIHESYGVVEAPWGGLVVNACNMTGNYELLNKPIVVTI